MESNEQSYKKKDIILIQAPPRFGLTNPPLGIMYIASFLEMYDYSVSIQDCTRVLKPELVSIIENSQPAIVGISSATESYDYAIKIAQFIKKINNNIHIVLGGPHATFLDTEALKTGVIDIVVRQEGEITMVELAEFLIRHRGKSLNAIAGITFKDKDRIYTNPSRVLIGNLDILPFPARHLTDLQLYPYPFSIITSRGCPAKCVYCAAREIAGKKWRFRSVDNIWAEIMYLKKTYNLVHFQIMDDAFTVNKNRAINICNRLIENADNLTWECVTRVDFVTPVLLEKMAHAGCQAIQFGVESGNEEVLKRINKGITLMQVEETVKEARKNYILPVCSFIIGHHVDTLATIKDTINFADKMRTRYDALVGFSINTPLPGTTIYNNAGRMNITMKSHEWSDYNLITPVMETPALKQNDIRNIYFNLKDQYDDSTEKDKMFSKIINEKNLGNKQQEKINRRY